jgi:hypothetical protein
MRPLPSHQTSIELREFGRDLSLELVKIDYSGLQAADN